MNQVKPKIIPIFFFQRGCPHRCIFCNQRITVGDEEPPPPVEVPRIVETALKRMKGGSRPIEVAFYGGSFTELPEELELEYLSSLSPFLKEERIVGIRISTRPDSFDLSHLLLLKERGVRVIELGVQSLDDRVLRLARRGHSASDAEQGVKLVKKAGLKVGVQLMIGLPGEDEESLMLTIRRVIELAPDFARIHPTLVLKDTELSSMYLRGEYQPLSLDEAIRRVSLMLILFEERSIPIIRIGLQPSPSLEEEGAIVAGPYHPSFRVLVEGRILQEMIRKGVSLLSLDCGEVIIVLSPAMVSSLKGLKGKNIASLKKEFPKLRFKIEGSSLLPRNKLKLISERREISVAMSDVISYFHNG